MADCVYCTGKKVLYTLMETIGEQIDMPLETPEGDAVDDAFNAIDDAWAALNDKCGHKDDDDAN